MDGPEVVLPEPGLEVVNSESQQQHLQSNQLAGLEVAYPNSTPQQIHEKPASDSNDTSPEPSPIKRGSWISGNGRNLLIILTVVLLVIIVIVLGAVLGTRLHSASGTPSKVTATPTVSAGSAALPTSTVTSTPTSIRANSKLAVTGWRTGQEYTIQLFYQGPDDYIRYSTYESTSGKWAAPLTTVKARDGSPIGLTAFNHSIYGGDDNMQTQLYYLDSSNYIREQDFSPGTTQSGSLSLQNYKASPSSALSTYWPSLVYEDDSGAFSEITYAGSITSNVWNTEQFTQSGAAISGSGLAEIPRTMAYTGLIQFYQASNGDLVQKNRDSGGSLNTVWSAESTVANIPKGSSISALFVPAGSGLDSGIYVLWQDATANIQVSSASNLNASWSAPSTYDALKGADNGTSITCLTPVTWYNVSIGTSPNLGRCYFQVNSAVREVEFDGGEWKALGDVPIP